MSSCNFNNTLSICIPTYNRKDRLKRCLDSFIDEALELKIPVYVSNNCSTDGTDKFLEEYKEKYPNLFYVNHPQNYGIDFNMDYVLRMADTEYALWLGDDDYIATSGGGG